MPEAPIPAKRRDRAQAELRRADPILARLIEAHPGFDPRAWLAEVPPMDAFGALIFQVIGQQLSVRATPRILERLVKLFGGALPALAERWRPWRSLAAAYLFQAAFEESPAQCSP